MAGERIATALRRGAAQQALAVLRQDQDRLGEVISFYEQTLELGDVSFTILRGSARRIEEVRIRW